MAFYRGWSGAQGLELFRYSTRNSKHRMRGSEAMKKKTVSISTLGSIEWCNGIRKMHSEASQMMTFFKLPLYSCQLCSAF